ncbi:hydrogenase maturation protease [Planctomycetota bacterium]
MGGQTLIMGLGNPVLTDDGVGIHVVERLRCEGAPEGARLELAGTCGLGLLEIVAGYERLVLVDAIDAGRRPGTVLTLGLEELDTLSPAHAASSHEVDLPTALELGRKLGLPMPGEVRIVAIQIADVSTFSETCTQAVRDAIAEACEVVRRICGV